MKKDEVDIAEMVAVSRVQTLLHSFSHFFFSRIRDKNNSVLNKNVTGVKKMDLF